MKRLWLMLTGKIYDMSVGILHKRRTGLTNRNRALFLPVGVIGLCLFLVTGCSSMKPEDFVNKTPHFDLFQYFEGQTSAWGLFEDRFGKVRRQFQVTILGTRQDNLLTLDEQFIFDDGEEDQRIWRIRKTGENRYEGEADDVIGVATGIASGNALNWRYDLDLKVGDSTMRVHFNDWMFLQNGNVMINRAQVSKWGFDVGQVTLFFTKPAIAAE